VGKKLKKPLLKRKLPPSGRMKRLADEEPVVAVEVVPDPVGVEFAVERAEVGPRDIQVAVGVAKITRYHPYHHP